MIMLRKFFVAFLICIVGVSQAQQLKVVEFRADLSMADANQFPKEDYSGNRCGLIKLGLALPPSDVAFEGDIISSENKEGEWWIYRPLRTTGRCGHQSEEFLFVFQSWRYSYWPENGVKRRRVRLSK